VNMLGGERDAEPVIAVLKGGLNSRSKLLPIQRVPYGFPGGALALLVKEGRCHQKGRGCLKAKAFIHFFPLAVASHQFQAGGSK